MIKKYLLITLFVITVIYYLPIIKLPVAPYDEAVILVGAERVLAGQIPYKDFLTVYGPGQVYTLAAVFKVLGTSVTSERIYDIAIKSCLSLLIFLIIRQLSSNKTAIAGWVMSLIWIDYSRFHAYPVYPSVLFTFLCIYFLVLHMRRGKLYYIVLSSASIVLAVLFRHDLGGLAAIAIALVLLVRRLTGAQRSWTPLVTYIASGIALGTPVILYFVLSDAKAVINNLIIMPLDMIANQQDLPYPALSRYNLPFYVFPLMSLTGITSFFIFVKRKMDETTAYGILLISAAGVAFFNQAWGRADAIHLLPSALAGILLSPILLDALRKMLSLSPRSYGLLFIGFIIFFGTTLSKPLSRNILLLPGNYDIEIINPEIERAKYSILAEDTKNTASYLKKNIPADDYIYVGVKNHDQLIFNNAIIYFLAERKCATKYHELNPGQTNTLLIQEEIVDELKSRSIGAIVLTPGWRDEPNLSSRDAKIDVLDNYIADHFELKETFGIYEIWMKKGGEPISWYQNGHRMFQTFTLDKYSDAGVSS